MLKSIKKYLKYYDACYDAAVQIGVIVTLALLTLCWGLNVLWNFQLPSIIIGTLFLFTLLWGIFSPAIISPLAMIGVIAGAKNKDQKIGEALGEIVGTYAEKATLFSAVFCLNFIVLGVISFQGHAGNFFYYFFGFMITVTVLWKYAGAVAVKLCVTVGIILMVIGLGSSLLTMSSPIASGLGINASLPNWEVNKANVSMKQAYAKKNAAGRVSNIERIEGKVDRGEKITRSDARDYNIAMRKINSDDRFFETNAGGEFYLTKVERHNSGIKRKLKDFIGI